MKVTLIRHTKVDVPKGTCYGFTDVPLAKTFPEEAARTLRNLEPLKPFDAVYSSPLTRARRLAAYCGYTNPILDDRLKEMNMGRWEMRLYDDIAREDPWIESWYDDFMHLRTNGGEGFPDLYARVVDFLEELKTKPFHHVAIFAHGGVLISAGIYGHLFPAEQAWQNLVDHGGIENIEI